MKLGQVKVSPSLEGFRVIAWHLIQKGDLIGIFNPFDPDDQDAKTRGSATLLISFALILLALVFVGPFELRLAAALILGSPIFLYAVSDFPERTLGGRKYAAMLGVALIAGWAAQYALWPVIGLLALWGIRTGTRAFQCRSYEKFWERAITDSPKKARCQLNYAAGIEKRDKKAAEYLLKIVVDHSNAIEKEKAYSNLARVYVSQGMIKEAEEQTTLGLVRLPNQPDCRQVRGIVRLHMERYEEAFDDFMAALSNADCPNADETASCAAIAAYHSGRTQEFTQLMHALIERHGPERTARMVQGADHVWKSTIWQGFMGLGSGPTHGQGGPTFVAKAQ